VAHLVHGPLPFLAAGIFIVVFFFPLLKAFSKWKVHFDDRFTSFSPRLRKGNECFTQSGCSFICIPIVRRKKSENKENVFLIIIL